jgi:hypothetical protein
MQLFQIFLISLANCLELVTFSWRACAETHGTVNDFRVVSKFVRVNWFQENLCKLITASTTTMMTRAITIVAIAPPFPPNNKSRIWQLKPLLAPHISSHVSRGTYNHAKDKYHQGNKIPETQRPKAPRNETTMLPSWMILFVLHLQIGCHLLGCGRYVIPL